MKQKTIMTIIITSVLSTVFAFVLSNYLFRSPKNRQQKTEVVQKITTDFKEPDKTYFNAQSINPTQIITIGDNNKQ